MKRFTTVEAAREAFDNFELDEQYMEFLIQNCDQLTYKDSLIDAMEELVMFDEFINSIVFTNGRQYGA